LEKPFSEKLTVEADFGLMVRSAPGERASINPEMFEIRNFSPISKGLRENLKFSLKPLKK
jgi:hypothetical protein